MKRPGYSLTRLAFWVSFVLAWGLIIGIMVAGLVFNAPQTMGLAGIVIPSMVLMVAGLLGIHRAFGSMDMRTAATAAKTSEEGTE
jgi:hypothetical protein